MSLLVCVLGLVVLAQNPKPLVRSIEVAEVACSRDGWCTELPGPVDVALAAGDGRRLVVGSTGGVLMLYEGGTWLPGLDSGLGRVTRLAVQADRVLACDDTRCVQVALTEGRLGPVVSDDIPRPRDAAPSRVEGTFGEGGRYALRNNQLQAFVGDQRIASRRAETALGGDGAPLWFARGGAVWRYTPASASAPEAWKEFSLPCSVWCGGWKGRLFGDTHRPVLQMHHVLVEGLYAFDGTGFIPLLSPAFSPKTVTRPVVGAGCAPCLVGPLSVAIRRPERWDLVRLPEAAGTHVVRELGLDARGWPLLVLHDPHATPPRAPESWAFDGTRWSRGGARGKTVRTHAREKRDTGPSPSWTTEPPPHDDRSSWARTPWGERWTQRGSTLGISGSGGQRLERLPLSFAGGEVFPGERGVFFTSAHGDWTVSKRWERFTLGQSVEVMRYRVVGVQQGDVLQVRRGPDPAAGSVASLAPGACVQGVGREVKGTGGTWWKVKDAAGAEGWSQAHSLRAESCPP